MDLSPTTPKKKTEQLGRHWGDTFKENPIDTKVAEIFAKDFYTPFDWSKVKPPRLPP